MFSPRPGSFGTSLETGEENKYLLTSVLVTVGTRTT